MAKRGKPAGLQPELMAGEIAWHFDTATGIAWVRWGFRGCYFLLPAAQAREFAFHILRAADNAEAEGRGEAAKYPPGVGKG